MVNSATPRVAVIDLGSNSVLLLVLQRGGRVLRDECQITRLGQGVFASGRLHPDARSRTRRAVESFVAQAREAGAERVVAVGTEALRRAADAPSFVEELCKETGLDELRILSGEQEAELAIEASRRSGGDELVVVDVGGGSTEIAVATRAGVRGLSLPLGSVRLTEALLPAHPIPAADLARAREAVAFGLREWVTAPAPALDVVATAGTATTLAALELALDPYDPGRVEGLELSSDTLGAWIARLSRLDLEARRALPGLEPGRADVIVGGLLILEAALARLRARAFRVSGRGVRHGVALRLLEGDGAVW